MASKNRLQYRNAPCIMKKYDLLEQIRIQQVQHKANCVVGSEGMERIRGSRGCQRIGYAKRQGSIARD